MQKDVKADRKVFTDAVRKLLAAPPLPKAAIGRKHSKKALRPTPTTKPLQ